MKVFAALALVGVASTVSACDVAAVTKCATDVGSVTCDNYGKMLGCYTGCDTLKSVMDLAKTTCKLTCTEAQCTPVAATCFPASATVELPGGVKKNMDQLVVGDKVHVGDGKYSEVYFFSTQLTETSSKFVKLSTDKAEVSLTAGHYLYANGKLVQASTVQVGDELTLADGSKSAVVAVSSTWGSGLYNPHTMTGDIVVDGVKTSTYTEAVHPKLAHALLFPVRQLYNAGVTFGNGFNAASKSLPNWILKAIQA